MVLLANQIVTFKYTESTSDPNTGRNTHITDQIVDVPVHIYRASRDAIIRPWTSEYSWAIIYDPDLAYPNSNGRLVQEGDEIWWDYLNNGHGVLARPIVSWGPFNSATGYFKEPGEG